MKRWKKVGVVAVAALVVAVLFTQAPVRSFAAELLSVFRVEHIQVVDINPDTLAHLEEALEAGDGTVEIEDFGRVSCSGNHDFRPAAENEVRQAVDFAVRLPQTSGFLAPSFGLMPESSVTFNLDVKKTNAVLQSLGSKTLLPVSLDQKEFGLRIPTVVVAEYNLGDGRKVSVAQGRNPEFYVPAGTDALALRAALLDLPILPESLKKQVAAVDDWQHTVLIPNVEGTSQEVGVNGGQGVFICNPDRAEAGGCLMWPEGGVLYMISGDGLSLADALNLAEALK